MEWCSVFQQLVSHNDDIKRLVDKGYAVSFDAAYLIVRDIPYLDDKGELKTAALVSKLVFMDQEHVTQDDHQVFFSGSAPFGLDGKPIPNLGGGPAKLPMGEASADVVVQRSFSNKPKEGKFADFFEKIESYVAIISGPAMERYGATPFTYRTVGGQPADSVFRFHDTLTSRAGISDLSALFKDDVIAVIGLGGTGSYLLDFLVKTPVRELRVFDMDPYHVHNAFRSPGKLDAGEFGKAKAEVYKLRYDNFRKGLTALPKLLDASHAEDLNGVTFAFICVDKGSSRAGVFDLLLSLGIPFIDVGMGLRRQSSALTGTLRMTYYSSADGQKIRDMRLAELSDSPADLYRSNIQISELNALNACLAVVRFKQLRGFYLEEEPCFNALFDIGDMKIVGSVQDPVKFRLQRVHYMPPVLEPRVLYMAEEFDIAMHLCACGCGSKVKTPLGPTEWSIEETAEGPTVRPSIGNWQQACKSHYFIHHGQVVWSLKWSAELIEAGRRAEEACRRAHYATLYRKKGIIERILGFARRVFFTR
jgi:hypothetical protein